MDPSEMACVCQNLTWEEIQQLCQNGAESFEDVQRATGCGEVCGQCVESITNFIVSARSNNVRD